MDVGATIQGNPRRSIAGGIASLQSILREHWSAIEYDLLTRTNYRLDCVGKTLPWSSLLIFLRHLPSDSATFRSMNPDYVEWSDPMKVVGLLADIMDAINGVRYDLRCMNKQKGEKAPKPPKPYPRPIHDDSKNEHVAFDKEEFKAFYFDN